MKRDISFLVYSVLFSLFNMVEIPNIILDGTYFCVVPLQAYEPWTLSRMNENFSYVTGRSRINENFTNEKLFDKRKPKQGASIVKWTKEVLRYKKAVVFWVKGL